MLDRMARHGWPAMGERGRRNRPHHLQQSSINSEMYAKPLVLLYVWATRHFVMIFPPWFRMAPRPTPNKTIAFSDFCEGSEHVPVAAAFVALVVGTAIQ